MTDPYAVGQNEVQPIPEIRTRAGYLARDALRAFLLALSQKGPVSAGQAIHHSADLVTSGALEAWMKQCWDYAFDHISLACPRIFVYLKKRINDIDDIYKKLPPEILYKDQKFQHAVAEIVLVLQGCPKRTRITFPKVSQDTHTDSWFNTIPSIEDSNIVRRVWKHGTDDDKMRIAANYILKSAGENATERALFWFKWLQEEDVLSKKNNGFGLSSTDRSTTGNKKDVGHFIVAVLAEAYKEWAVKGLLRMHEEFQTLIDIWRSKEKRASGRRRDALILMILILTDVPKWKVPASPKLVEDPVALGRAVSQSTTFFTEVLSYAPSGDIIKSLKPSKEKKTIVKTTQESKIDESDKLFLAYYGIL